MKRITVLIASALCLIACNNEVDFVAPEIDSEEGRITLYLPDATMETYSTATESECMIDSVWVLEFNGGNLVNDTLIKGANILWNGSAMQLLPQLPFEPALGCTIVFIANCNATTAYPSGFPYTNIEQYFSIPRQVVTLSGGEHLPMYGEIKNWQGDTYSCEMIRAMAKIQVQMAANAIDVTGNFNAENVTWSITYGGRGGYIQPQTPIRWFYLAEGGWTSSFLRNLLQKENATEAQKTLYLNEFPSSNTTGMLGDPYNSDIPKVPHILPVDSFYWSRQHIILHKDDGVHPATFYRLDFYDPITRQFIDTKRNHHYIFTIHRIGSEGYPTVPGPVHYPGSNIEYTIEVKDGSNHVTSNGQYAVVTSVDSAYIAASVTNAFAATVRYQLPAGMSYNLAVVPNLISMTSYPPSSVSFWQPQMLTNVDAPFLVSTTSLFDSARVELSFGNIKHYIILKKKP